MQPPSPPSSRTTRIAARVALSLAALSAMPAAADIVVLKNGRRIQARVLQRGERTTELELPYGRFAIPSREIEAIEPERSESYLADQAEILARQGSFARAIELYEEAIRLRPDSIKLRSRSLDLRVRQGEWLLSVGRLQEAHIAFRRALEEDPRHEGAREGLERLAATEAWVRDRISRGREAAERGQWADAVEALEPVLERIPTLGAEIRRPLAAAHARLGDGELSAGRFREATDRYETALAIDPDLIAALANRYVFARIRCAAPLLEKGDFERARTDLRDALAILPDSAALKYFLALAHEGLGRPSEAAELYASIAGPDGRSIDPAREIDILRRRAEEELGLRNDIGDPRWREGAEEEEILPTEHFRIVHRNRFAAGEVARAAEAWLRRISSILEPTDPWPKPCEILLHPSADAFRSAAGQPEWSGGATRIERRLGICLSHRIHLHQGSKQLIPSVVPHEVGHVVLAWALGYDTIPPLWADEGFAVDQEPAFKRAHFERILRDALRQGTLIPLEALFARADYGEDPELFYAQSHAVARFLLERRGPKAFVAFLRDLDPARPAEALRGHFGIGTISELENLWLRRIEAGDQGGLLRRQHR